MGSNKFLSYILWFLWGRRVTGWLFLCLKNQCTINENKTKIQQWNKLNVWNVVHTHYLVGSLSWGALILWFLHPHCVKISGGKSSSTLYPPVSIIVSQSNNNVCCNVHYNWSYNFTSPFLDFLNLPLIPNYLYLRVSSAIVLLLSPKTISDLSL